MKYQFTLPDFPDSNFQIEVSFWTGKQTLYKDEVLVERSVEIGKPFLISDSNGKILKASPKSGFTVTVPMKNPNMLIIVCCQIFIISLVLNNLVSNEK